MRQKLSCFTDSTSPARKDRLSTAAVRRESEKRILYVVGGILVLALLCACSASVAVADEPQRPNFEQVATAVTDYLRSQPNYQDGDLVSQKQVAAALDAVAEVGWEVPDRDQLEQRAFADGSFLVTQLSTPAASSCARSPASRARTSGLTDSVRSHVASAPCVT